MFLVMTSKIIKKKLLNDCGCLFDIPVSHTATSNSQYEPKYPGAQEHT